MQKTYKVAHKFYEDGSKGRVCAKCGKHFKEEIRYGKNLKNIIQKKLHLLLCQSSPTKSTIQILNLIKSLSM